LYRVVLHRVRTMTFSTSVVRGVQLKLGPTHMASNGHTFLCT